MLQSFCEHCALAFAVQPAVEQAWPLGAMFRLRLCLRGGRRSMIWPASLQKVGASLAQWKLFLWPSLLHCGADTCYEDRSGDSGNPCTASNKLDAYGIRLCTTH